MLLDIFPAVIEYRGYFASAIRTHPLLEKGDTFPVEDRGGERSAGPRRSDTLHNTWQQLPKVELSFWQLVLLLLEISQSGEQQKVLERFLQKFCITDDLHKTFLGLRCQNREEKLQESS